MTRKELEKEFIEVQHQDGVIQIYVKTIHWPEPHTPATYLEKVKTLRPNKTKRQLERSINSVLKNTKYFRTCDVCKELNPSGWTESTVLCSSCAETVYGIVH